ncbi:hypothetical protein P43SY_005787 [Pythium insidiosum]|uniref:Hcy-binding domain-containing protein n=1 Tax=Pythium insidiosum TaxID=114742 RepID=A0AAD5LUG9_PYTIN|nr:hypothetical protein P43SY_005787 [Pythium insidiosum]
MAANVPPAVELLDGGTGEELFRCGVPDDRKLWSATALVHSQYHDVLTQVHAAFLDAGSDLVTCNNYGVTPGVGFREDDIARYCELAGRLARRAVSTHKPTARVCGSLPPLLESYRPDKLVEFDDGVHLYSVMGAALQPHVDMFLGETLSTIDEAKMALTGVQDYGKPVLVSFTLRSDGALRSGDSVVDVIRELLRFTTFSTPSVQLYAVLFNCSLPEAISSALHEIQAADGLTMKAFANRLTEIAEDWALAESAAPQAMRTDLDVARYVKYVNDWVNMGAQLIGGCCGIGPEYIAQIHETLKQRGLRT